MGQHGPFAEPAPAGKVSLAAVARGELFDPALTSSTGDVWLRGVASTGGAAPAATPLTIAPGATATITVTITPAGAAGTVVRGHLYIDTFSEVTLAGDELIDLPYAYTVG